MEKLLKLPDALRRRPAQRNILVHMEMRRERHVWSDARLDVLDLGGLPFNVQLCDRCFTGGKRCRRNPVLARDGHPRA